MKAASSSHHKMEGRRDPRKLQGVPPDFPSPHRHVSKILFPACPGAPPQACWLPSEKSGKLMDLQGFFRPLRANLSTLKRYRNSKRRIYVEDICQRCSCLPWLCCARQPGCRHRKTGIHKIRHQDRAKREPPQVKPQCLPGPNGTFTSTDNPGTTYQLQGDTSRLSKHVGHEVQITGPTSGFECRKSSTGMPQGSSQQQSLILDKVKHISENSKTMSE